MIEIIEMPSGKGWLLPITVVAIIGIIVYLKRHNKKIDLTGFKFGPATLKITDIPVKRISFLTQPKDAAGRPAILTDIKVRVYDENNKPLGGRKIVIELDSHSKINHLRGILERSSDSTGSAVFSGLKISRTGEHILIAKSEGEIAVSVPFEITPPGLDTNFSDKPFNSPEYKETLARNLALSKVDDELCMDEEEI